MRAKPFEVEFVFSGQQHYSRPEELTQERILEEQVASNREWTARAKDRISTISQGRVEKPSWFKEQESNARSFVSSLGLVGAKGTQITVVNPHTPEINKAAFSMDSDDRIAKGMNWQHEGIMIRDLVLDEASKMEKPEITGKIMAHELVHSAEFYDNKFYNRFDKQTRKWRRDFRQGFQTKSKNTANRGMFYAEAVAEYVGGLYVRRGQDSDCELVSVDMPLADTLPEHYADYEVDFGVPAIAGPDGYAMELLAWGVEQKGIIDRDSFIRSALGTYSLDAAVRLPSYRQFASSIDGLEKGLYVHLRDLEYGHESWQAAQAKVHSVVTK